jgi:serine/threonine protein kinase
LIFRIDGGNNDAVADLLFMKNPQTMKSGEVLCDRYRLGREIGKGGMGTVWAAYDCKANHTVALKMILPQLKQRHTQELRGRLLREARAIKKLQHPNIVQIYAVGETPQGEPFLVLEYLQGQTLADMLKESWRIEPRLTTRIIAEVASGLAVAHGEQVIHRDLKPANIFLRRAAGASEDVPTILDFGVCKELDVIDDINTETGVVPGSLAYMSPEQILAGEELDRRTDIWSLGIVLYELLTGERPFTGSAVDVYNQILTKPVPAPSRRVRDVPPKLDAVVARCTAKLSDRYSDASELASDLFAIAAAREMKRTPTPMAHMVPIVKDESDLALTLPRKVDELRRTEARAGRAERAGTGTELMPLNQPIPSPAPEWKKEMFEALQAHRQTSMHLERALHEGVPSGQTVMLDRPNASEPIRNDSTCTTSALSALSQPGIGAAPMPLALSRRARPISKKALFGAAGFVFVMVAVLMMWSASSLDKPRANAAPSASPTNDALKSERISPPKVVDSGSTPDTSMSAPVAVPPAPQTTASTSSAPNKSIAPKASSAAALRQLPTNFDSPWVKPLKKPQKCTGYGVFKRCK